MPLFGKKGKQIEIEVRGMTCGHCEMRVKKALMDVPGVKEAEASHEKGLAVVTLAPKQEVAMDALVLAVQDAGYQAGAEEE